jgi:hypothetical protein
VSRNQSAGLLSVVIQDLVSLLVKFAADWEHCRAEAEAEVSLFDSVWDRSSWGTSRERGWR